MKIGNKPFTMAQRVMLACGVDPFMLDAHHKETRRNPHNRKSGPGRVHLQGKRKEAA